MNLIKTLVKLIPVGIAFFICAWFVTFQFNPYKWCKDHPDREKSADYYLCEPFEFELKKGVIDRKTKIAGEDHWRGQPRMKRSNTKKNYNCNDEVTLMTEDGYNYCMGIKK